MTPSNRLGTHSIATLRTMTSDRDLEILRFVRDHRHATTKQIQRALFSGHATPLAAIRACVRALTKLEQKALLYKLGRQIGGIHAGSGSYIWAIDDAGDRLLRAEDGEIVSKRHRTFEPSALFLAHTLAITEVRVLLEEAAQRGDFELLSVTTEPRNWRTFLSHNGATQVLKPDLEAITASGDYEDHWLFEIDNGTESLPTVLRKCHIYQRHYETGSEQSARGVYPKVVWLIASPRRLSQVQAAIASDQGLHERLFLVTQPAKLLQIIEGAATPDEPEVKTIPQHQTSGLANRRELSSGGHTTATAARSKRSSGDLSEKGGDLVPKQR